jgi:hypothetical protein
VGSAQVRHPERKVCADPKQGLNGDEFARDSKVTNACRPERRKTFCRRNDCGNERPVSVGNSDSSWALTRGKRIRRPAPWRQHRIKDVFSQAVDAEAKSVHFWKKELRRRAQNEREAEMPCMLRLLPH